MLLTQGKPLQVKQLNPGSGITVSALYRKELNQFLGAHKLNLCTAFLIIGELNQRVKTESILSFCLLYVGKSGSYELPKLVTVIRNYLAKKSRKYRLQLTLVKVNYRDIRYLGNCMPVLLNLRSGSYAKKILKANVIPGHYSCDKCPAFFIMGG